MATTKEFGSDADDARSSTFCLTEEDHTLATRQLSPLRSEQGGSLSHGRRSPSTFSFGMESLVGSMPNLDAYRRSSADRSFTDRAQHYLPRVSFCGYSVPHPSENRVNIRVQTTGLPARDLLKDALQDLMGLSDHVRVTFARAVEEHRASQALSELSVGTSTKSGVTHETTSSTKSHIVAS